MRVTAPTVRPGGISYECFFSTTSDMVRASPAEDLTCLHHRPRMSRIPTLCSFPSQVTAIVESTNETLAGLTMTKLNPLSILPTCVALKFIEVLDAQAGGANTAAEDPADAASVPTNVANVGAKRDTTLLAAEQSKERERNRLKPHGR